MSAEKTCITLLKNKLHEQEAIYLACRENNDNTVRYREYRHEEFGLSDKNYSNRLRLSYYLLYEKIDDEAVIASLFEEELQDRETNSFQGIGCTLPVLTQLLKKYNVDARYDALFKRAKNANFDCACGYDTDVTIDEEIEHLGLLDCIFLAQDLDYKDIMADMVSVWKKEVTDWNAANRQRLIDFNSFLDKEAENETLYQQFLTEAEQKEKKKTADIASACKDLIGHYMKTEQYAAAYRQLNRLLTGYDLREIKQRRLYASLMEYGFEIIVHEPAYGDALWALLKPELTERTNMFGNLYIKGIAAAKAVHDPYAEQLEREYENWRESVRLK